jgi:cysteine desulfurase NifS
MYAGLEYNGNGVQTVRAVLTLLALSGNLDVPGGHCFKMKRAIFPINRAGLVANPNAQKAAGHNSFPLYTRYRGEFHAIALPQAVLRSDPYRIRALLSLGASIITSWPQSAIWRKTLAGLDFLVCIDRQRTADMAYADIVLPASTYYETESYMVYDSAFRIRERLAAPVGEARYDFFILSGLADRLGYDRLYPQDSEALLAYVLAGSGFTPQAVRDAGGTVQVAPVMMEYRKWEKGLLREDGAPGFDTPTGKFEIASSILEEYGYDPLPRYVEPKESPASRPDMALRFPLVFNSGAHHNADLHALHHSVPALAEELPAPYVAINSRDAARRGIANGERVVIKTARGEVAMYARVTDDIVEGAIEASGAGGGALGSDDWRASCVNELTDLDNFDPISGFPAYKALLCDVERAGAGASRQVVGTGEYAAGSAGRPEAAQAAIYLDHNATTPLDASVKEAMVEALARYGNPSAIYSAGREAHAAVEEARRALSLLIGCTPRRLVFTSGGSEGNNFIIKGIALACGPARNHLVASSVEHPSVLEACRFLERIGFSVTYLPVDGYGTVSPADLAAAITERTCLVSIMAANNETGTLQPVRELARIARGKGVLFHTDAVQAVGKIEVDADAWGVDFLTLSPHKFHGPKGVGAVYVRKGVGAGALIHGGKQEGGLRGGTENTPGIVGAGRAALLAAERLGLMEGHVRTMRDSLYAGIRRAVPGARLNGHPESRLPNTLNVTLPDIRGESLLLALDARGVFFSSGSACKSGDPAPSHVLLAMGLSEEEAHCSLRFSLGVGNTDDEIGRAVELIGEVLSSSAKAVRFVSCR